MLPKDNVIEYGYDTAGRLLTLERKPDDQASSHGERVRYELDDYGQRDLELHERWETGAWVEHSRTDFVYLTRCHLDSITVGSSQVVAYNYDRFGRMIQDGQLSFDYDANGNRTDIGYPGGLMATYTFDYADREATLEVNDGGGAQAIVTSASYLPSGPLDGLVLGNGLEEIRPYDSRYYPDEIRVNDGMADLLHWSYTVDAVGNPEAIADVLTPANDRSYVYQDYQYFLTSGDGPWGTYTWTYDTIGNRLTEDDGSFEDTYDYVPNAAMGSSPKLAQITTSGGFAPSSSTTPATRRMSRRAATSSSAATMTRAD